MTDSRQELLNKQIALDETIDCQPLGFAILSDWQALQVKGDDAEDFLQNLLTNDVKTTVLGQAQLNGFCQAKGRLLAIFWLVRRINDFVLVLPADQAAFLCQRLCMFKLRSKVDIQPIENHLLLALSDTNTCTDIGVTLNHELAMALLPSSAIDNTVTQFLKAGMHQQSSHCWQQTYIRAGYPMIFEASRECFTAQQVNLDLAGGVSFRKGCYPGQEVVARLHYLGEAKRRLFIGEVGSHDLPMVGTDIYTVDGEVAGQLVQSCPIEDGRSLMQISLKLAMAQRTLFLPDKIEITNLQPFAGD